MAARHATDVMSPDMGVTARTASDIFVRPPKSHRTFVDAVRQISNDAGHTATRCQGTRRPSVAPDPIHIAERVAIRDVASVWHHDCICVGAVEAVMRETTAVLVAERDGDWSDWVESLRGEADDIAVVLQRMGESPSAFATRVRERVQELRARGELVAAALVGGDRWDAETLSARSLMIRAIVAEMSPAHQGQLYLDAGRTAGRGRYAMQALASVVEDQIPTGVDVLTAGPRVPVRTPRAA